MPVVRTGPGRVATVALVAAAGYATLLLAAGFLVPVYEVTSDSSAGATHGSATLVAVNGPAVAAVLALPLAAVLLVAVALWERSRRGAAAIAWTVTALLAALTLLGMLSVGLFVAPVTVALLVACATGFRAPAEAQMLSR